jgi:hypothetical protein
MSGRKKKPRSPIHACIKTALGYEADEPDADVLKDWKERTSRVCKPCWELKYCPYGPLVEQSPTLPLDRSSAIEHRENLQQALATGQFGSVDVVDDRERRIFRQILKDDDLLFQRALHHVEGELEIQNCALSADPVAAFNEVTRGHLPPIHEYRVPFDKIYDPPIDRTTFEPEFAAKVDQAIAGERRRLEQAIATGLYDNTTQLDDVRRASFENDLRRPFNPENHPEQIPRIFQEAVCNIFEHICPVFFAAEALGETQEQRRRGRYIPFKTKMRVVRRDNHTCQHCGAHLRDDEVEFDHVIPVSKGGSSEEHNIRLTCFDCNRDKSDKVAL